MTESKKTDTTMPNNVIKYEACEKLWGGHETESLLGPYPGAFNVSIRKHTFCNGKGTIAFHGDVTSINDYAFFDCSGLTSITIPNSVTSIGDCAFNGCSGLTSVTIPNSVTSIGKGTFARCFSLTSVNIPNSVVRIEEMAFWGCTSLPVENNLRYADTILLEAVDKSLSTYTIKPDTKWIGHDAFKNCTSLISITIPNSVTSIGYRAFSNCISLTSVAIPNSVTSIGGKAFYNCTSLTSVAIPNSVTSIEEGAFCDIKAYRTPTIGDGTATGYKGMQLDDEKMSCRSFEYKVGHSYHMNNIRCCTRGFHFCTDILDVFAYYYGEYDKDFTICEVEGKGDFDISDDFDSKVCTSDLKVLRRLPIDEVTKLINESISNADNRHI